MRLLDIVLGKPLPADASARQRVGALTGVPVLGLDALASAAYGPEALLTVLLPLGALALDHTWGLTLAIMSLLFIVFLSYRQTITVYPNGGGAYAVAKLNLGRRASLIAAAALALDYVLNVAVAIAAGVGALVSAVPALLPYSLPLCLAVLLLLTLINLRGVHATGVAFMLPTWLFVGSLFGVIALGVAQTLGQDGAPTPLVTPPSLPTTLHVASLAMLVHAFASGCTAMTGVEAVSNAVPIFRPPTMIRARRTLTIIIAILMVLLAGEAFLCRAYNVTATVPGQVGYQSVLSQLVGAVVGRGPFYYVALGSVVMVLALSANTSFAAFPRLCQLLARDHFLPEAMVRRGRRLVYSHGILLLSGLSGMLLVTFQGITDHLIPLFAIGAFLAFTMSQAGMVAHWLRQPGANARRAMAMNAIGMLATGSTGLVILIVKFEEGAWISAVMIVGALLLFQRFRSHYEFREAATATDASLELNHALRPLAVVPIRRWNALARKALRFGVGLSPDVIAVQVVTGDQHVEDLRARWDELVVQPARRLGMKPPELVIVRSRYRRLILPLLDYVRELEHKYPERQIAVIVAQLVERPWFNFVFHGYRAALLKALLLLRGGPRLVIVSTPWYLGGGESELHGHDPRS